jgi:hypothetical protein
MIQIRSGVFETNSSSTHSLTMCTQEEFDKWKRGEIWFDTDYERLVDKEIVIEFDEEESKENYISTHPNHLFYKTWEELSEEEIKKWHSSYFDKKKAESDEYYRYKTYQQYFHSYGYDGLERFEQHYTSPSGDKIVAFGKYGYDG